MTRSPARTRGHPEKAVVGNADAMNNLGLLYQNSRGVPRSYAEARRWYEKAPALGNANAIKNLALMPKS